MSPPPFAAEAGFSFADPIALALVFAGVAVLAAVGALSHEGDRAPAVPPGSRFGPLPR